MFPEWLSANKPLSRYDIFLSYRWSKFDSAFVQILFDRFSLYTVDSISKRCIDSFLDNKRLPEGLNFQEAFGSALVNSMLITPIISQNTLERMVGARFDPSKEDNVLVEWILSLECLRHTGTPLTRVRAICPVIMGKYDDKSGVFSSLFEDQAFLDQMSSKVPLQSLAVVKHLLQKNNIPVDDARLSSYTVRSVVLSMTKMNFIVVDKSFEYSSIFVAASEKLKRCLEGFIEQDNSNLTYNLHSLSPQVAVGGGGITAQLPPSVSRETIDVSDLKAFLDVRNIGMKLQITPAKIDDMVRVLHASDIKSREAFAGLRVDELDEVMTSCQPPLPIGLRGNLRAIHSNKQTV